MRMQRMDNVCVNYRRGTCEYWYSDSSAWAPSTHQLNITRMMGDRYSCVANACEYLVHRVSRQVCDGKYAAVQHEMMMMQME
jgi:hypothetical protein